MGGGAIFSLGMTVLCCTVLVPCLCIMTPYRIRTSVWLLHCIVFISMLYCAVLYCDVLCCDVLCCASRQVRKDHYKGMSPEQRAAIRQQQLEQMEAARAASAAAAAEAAQAAAMQAAVAHERDVQVGEGMQGDVACAVVMVWVLKLRAGRLRVWQMVATSIGKHQQCWPLHACSTSCAFNIHAHPTPSHTQRLCVRLSADALPFPCMCIPHSPLSLLPNPPQPQHFLSDSLLTPPAHPAYALRPHPPPSTDPARGCLPPQAGPGGGGGAAQADGREGRG